MNTLSIFPDLLTFWLIAPLVLRITTGLIFIYFGYNKTWKEKDSHVSSFNKVIKGGGLTLFWIVLLTDIIGGAFLVVGLFTQATALILSILTIGAICTKIRKPNLFDNSLEFFILLLVVLLSLLFLGAGFMAIDLPL